MDRLKLEYVIKKSGITIDEFCEALGINRSTYYRKTRGISEFTQSEIMAAMKLLDIKDPCSIFFNDEVS